MGVSVSLSDLCGKHILFAVWFQRKIVPNEWNEWDDNEDTNHCYFHLDGVTYVAREDANDGYRSSMRDIQVVGDIPLNWWTPGEPVVAIYYTQKSDAPDYSEEEEWYDEGVCDLLSIGSEITGKTILTVGTDNSQDYYPSFVSHFQPQNLSHNIGKEMENGTK
jgi:hypothetical protein